MRRILAFIWCITLLVNVPQVHASIDDWEWDFSGFASLGIGKTNRDELQYMDYDGDWSVDSDSTLGLQLVVEPTERFSLTGQVVARGFSFDSKTSSYEPEVEWLFASFELFDASRMRIGRLRTPHSYYSDSLEVGYSYLWARPPVEAYPFILSPFTHIDGLDYTFNIYREDSDLEVKLVLGEADGNFWSNEVEVERVWGFTLLNRWENFSLRYAFLDHTINFHIPFIAPLLDQLELAAEFNPDYAKIADNYELEEGRSRYHSLAAEWHVAGWHVMAERYEFEPPKKQLDNHQRGWFVSIAYPIEQVTPYFVVGAYKSVMGKEMYDLVDDVYEDSLEMVATSLEPLLAIPPAFRPPEVVAGIAQLQSIQAGLEPLRDVSIAAINLYRVSQRSYTTGVRWDFHEQAAFKAELQYTEFARGSTGHYIAKKNEDAGQQGPNDAMSITLILDVVF